MWARRRLSLLAVALFFAFGQRPSADDTVPVVAIHDIQGSESTSPFAGKMVTTTGVVTGNRPGAFYLQTPDSEIDANPATSEGILVLRVGAPFARGTLLRITGMAVEAVPAADPGSPPVTLIASNPAPTIVVLSTNNPLPQAVTLAPADDDPAGGPDVLERFEGMRVHIASLTVVGPTLGTINEIMATTATNGVFVGVVEGVPRPFREPGLEPLRPRPPGAPGGVPLFDGNFERIRVDSAIHLNPGVPVAAQRLNVAAGQVARDLVGPLDYLSRAYTLVLDPFVVPGPPMGPGYVVTGSQEFTAVPSPAEGQFTVASLNLQRLYDATNDLNLPPSIEPLVMASALTNRIGKLSLLVRDVMRSPDVIGVQEVENLTTLQLLADRINDDAGTPGDYRACPADPVEPMDVGRCSESPDLSPYLQEGNDIGGLDVGFLVRSSRVHVVDVTQEGRNAEFLNPSNGQLERLNDRPPLVLEATIQNGAGQVANVTVIVSHLLSKTDIVDPVRGERVREKRRAQAEFLAGLVQTRQAVHPDERLIVIGDFNAFQFNDGLVDVVGTIKGTPAPPDQVTLASSDVVDPDLIDLGDLAPADRRYSVVSDGNAQETDHVLVTANLTALAAGLQYGRANADFPESLRGVFTRPERASDHDPLVAYFRFPALTTTVLVSSGSPSGFAQNVTFTATVTSAGQAVTEGEVLFSADGAPLGTVPVDQHGQAVQATASLGVGTHTITADYSGAATFNTSHAFIEHVVLPALSINDVFFAEGDAGLTHAVFTLTLDPAPDDEVTVRLATVDGTAAAGIDYAAITSLMVTFPPGTATQQVAVPLVGETVFETDETFEARLSDATGAVIVDTVGTGTILNDDPIPSISIHDASGREPASGIAALVFAVELSNPSAFPVMVSFATADDNAGAKAKAGRDYVAASGMLTFAPLSTMQGIGVTLLADHHPEPQRSFTIALDAPVNATIDDGAAVGTIFDADAPRINSVSPSAGTPGQRIVITGVDFVGIRSVSFNGVPAAFTGRGTTTIFATVPEGASTGFISVTGVRGTGTSLTEFVVTGPAGSR